ncbi:MAG: SprB repeat-containing protein, partial [Prevotellaceae bacterium]|nr:SprB repeat-containing protein [Prevotellaceae bacterium]
MDTIGNPAHEPYRSDTSITSGYILPHGVYRLEIVDVNHCTADTTIALQEYHNPFLSKVQITDVTCFGQSDGTIQTEASGGVGSYTYQWSNDATTPNVETLAAGSYEVTLTDENGCTATNKFDVSQPNKLQITATKIVSVTCFGQSDGTIQTASSGGVGSYTYQWSNGVTTPNVETLAVGSYEVMLTDENGCTTTNKFDVSQPDKLQITAAKITDVTCFGFSDGIIQTEASGGVGSYTYQWSNGVTTPNVETLASGSYEVTLTDENGCTTTNKFDVSQPEKLQITATKITDVTCFGQSDGVIQTGASGGVGSYTYQWSNDATTPNVETLAAGSYEVTLTDENGCTTTNKFDVSQPEKLQITATKIVSVTCFGQSDGVIQTASSGGVGSYTYQWSNGAITPNIETLAAGSYEVTRTDENGCTITNKFDVSQPNKLQITAAKITDVTCFGQSDGVIQTVSSGGVGSYTYQWSNGATTPNIATLAAGSYEVTLTDENGCTTTNKFDVSQPNKLQITATKITDVTCFGFSDG